MEYKGVASIPGGDSFLGDKGPTDGSLFAVVLPYVILIIVCPIASFFFSKSYLFEDYYGYKEMTANVYAAICSVVILHILLGLFIYKAFKESPVKGLKQD